MFTRKIRITGETLTVARPQEIGADPSEGKWVTFCEDHKTLVYSATQALAYYTNGYDFCDECRVEAGRIGMDVVTPATPKAEPAPAAEPIKLAYANGQEIKVHAAGCADLKKAATKREAHNGIHTQTFPAGTDEREVWIDFNDDFLEEGGADAAYPLVFLPCCYEAGLVKNADRTWA